MRYKKNLIHIRLRPETHHKLRVACARRRETIQTFAEEAIEQALSPAPRQAPRKASGDAPTVAESKLEYSTDESRSVLPTREEGDSIYLDLEGLPGEEVEVVRGLSKVDWTFAGAETQEHAHALHPYPAKFIPQIPRKLIQALHPADGSAVLDPFCGSGTALLEAVLLGLPAIGVDVNPLAVLIAKVKTTALDRPLDRIVGEITQRASSRLREGDRVAVPEIPRLDHWFKPDIARTVAVLVEEIERQDVDDDSRDAVRVALSGILVRVSNQESDVRYAAVDKPVNSHDVIRLFERNAMEVSRRLTSVFHVPLFRDLLPSRATVVQADTRDLHKNLPRWRVGLIVTSPPYPNAYEYWLYHKYRMYWLGMDPIAARRDEIGTRPHYSKKNGLTAQDFAEDMRSCFRAFSQLMHGGRYACFLVGNSRVRGTYVDNGSLLTSVAENYRFRLRARFPRHIPATRKSFNPALGSIRREALLVFRKE